MIGVLRRLFHKLHAAFPRATLRIRLDGGFASPAVFAFLEAEGVKYLVAMASNARLEKRVRWLPGKARMRSQVTGETATLFGETRYAAQSWKRKRRVLLTAAAYVLLQTLRQHLATPAVAQVSTLRERLIKLGTRVSVLARRIVLHLPSAFPWLALWQAVALALGARTG